MPKINKLSLLDKRTYKIIIMVFMLIIIVMGALCFLYYNQVHNTVKTEAAESMQEISQQMSRNAGVTINNNFSVLGTIATVLKNSNSSSYEQIQTIVNEQKDHWSFQKVMLIDENGVAYDEHGDAVVLNSDKYLQDAIVNGQHSMSSSQVIDGQDCIVFAIPLDNVIVEGNKMAALAASYDLSTFDKILLMNSFDDKGYAHIINKDGRVVIRSSSVNAAPTGYNILNSISTGKDNDEMEMVKKNIAAEKMGQIEIIINDDKQYMTYSPLLSHGWSLLTFVPVSVINAKSELLLKITLLLCSFITVAFSTLIAYLMISSFRNKHRLEEMAYVDDVTGGNTIQRFYELVEEKFKSPGKIQYALVYMNIEKFKVLNEEFGKDACDNVLRKIVTVITSDLSNNECVGRLFADKFCVLVEYNNEPDLAARFDNWYRICAEDVEGNDMVWLPLTMEFGTYVISNLSMHIDQIVDRAKLALTETTREHRGKIRYGIFDEDIRLQLIREKHLEDMMEQSLENREFQVYLQPKYFTQNEKIGGAEALVRWKSVSEGMIYPDEFITVFEKNGFILRLDLWVFEEVCRTIRKWIDAKCKPIKISVNCSRMHLKNLNFLDKYVEIIERYKISPEYIEIELTENIVFEDVTYLTHTIDKIHTLGFGCSMDDFGSGYSSLNLIQYIPVDTIKLDRIFFQAGANDERRTEAILGSIITMSKALDMKTVAEGVEERYQVDMLKRLNCDFIQGYFFAKPMPIADFESLAYNLKFENTGDRAND